MHKKTKLKLLHFLSSIFFGVSWLYYGGGGVFHSNLLEESLKIIGLIIIGYLITGLFSYMSAYFALKYFSNFNPETEEINFESDEAIIILSTAYIATILFCLIILFAEVGFFESIEGKYLNSLL